MEEKINYYTEARARGNAKYLSKLDEIKIRIPKGKKEEYKKMADASGKSLNQFIIDCIEAKIKK